MLENKKYKILFTGAHAATTAIATIEEIKRRKIKNLDLFWIGAKNSVEGTKQTGLENLILPALNVKTFSITSGRIQKKLTKYTIPSLMKIPFSFVDSYKLVKKINPDLVVSFGGYTAFSICFVAFFLKKKVIIHEQTQAAGLANKMSAFFSDKIALASSSSRKFYPKNKVEIVGNPMLSSIVKVKPKLKMNKIPVLYITGGSRGSQRINLLIKEILPQLLEKFEVVHQTGSIDFDKFNQLKNSMEQSQKRRYQVFSTISPWEVSKYYSESDIILGRAGANSVYEIIHVGRPSILIPIPWTRYDEQNKNALLAKNLGIAKVLNQETTTPESLLREILETLKDWDKIVKKYEASEKPNIDGSGKFVDLILSIL